jgi:hypothetical protein
MKIAYHNTLDDLLALQRCMLRHSAFGRKLMLHRFLVVEIILLFICLMFAVNDNPFKVFLIFTAISVIAWTFRERSVILQFKKDFKKELRKDEENSFAQTRIMQIGPQGLEVSTGANHQNHPWPSVEWTGQDKHLLYIITRGVLHYAVPKSVFQDEEELEIFLKLVDTYRAGDDGSADKAANH